MQPEQTAIITIAMVCRETRTYSVHHRRHCWWLCVASCRGHTRCLLLRQVGLQYLFSHTQNHLNCATCQALLSKHTIATCQRCYLSTHVLPVRHCYLSTLVLPLRHCYLSTLVLPVRHCYLSTLVLPLRHCYLSTLVLPLRQCYLSTRHF